MHKVAIMQPYFFPYLGYYQLIAAVDKFIVYDDVSFIKQGWIARNRILLNGQPHAFSIPLNDASSFKLILDTELHQTKYPLWREKFLKTLKMTYTKASCFSAAYDLVATVLHNEHRTVSSLATASLTAVCDYLSVNTQIIKTSKGLGKSGLKGQERIIDICKKEGATQYLNLPGGKDLYSKEDFRTAGIALSFTEPLLPQYGQTAEVFHPGLSMIDVMMFNTKEECCFMLKQFRLT